MAGARLRLDEPHAFLAWLTDARAQGVASFADVDVAHAFAVAAVAALARAIRDAAAERMPKRIVHRWLRFEEPGADVQRLIVSVASEDTAAALEFAATTLQPRVLQKESVALDFRNVRVCTQSYVHALLHETVRLAWAKKCPIYVINVTPAVRAQLELVESYSLGG